MADLIDLNRAKLNKTLAGISNDLLEALIAAASDMVIRYCRQTFEAAVPKAVEEAVVQLCLVLAGAGGPIKQETLGDYSVTFAESGPGIDTPAAIAKLMLIPYVVHAPIEAVN